VRDPNDPKWKLPPLTKNDPFVRRYLIADEIIRKTVLKCLTESQFATKFTSDATVAKAYPIVARSRKPARGKSKP
jgi:hypothetical protein